MLLLYRGAVHPGQEIRRLGPILAELNLRYDVLVSVLPARQATYEESVGPFWDFGFTEEVRSFADTLKHDDVMAAKFMRACADRGVYFHAYGSLVKGHHGISASHTLADIDEALSRIETALGDLKLT